MKFFAPLFASIFLLSMAPVRAEAATRAQEPTVVLISIDGFPAWMWKDPALPVPTLRRLAAEGALAENMTVGNPSVTWISHTTMVTGVSARKHGVLYNGLLVRQGPGEPPVIEQWRDKADLVRVPTLYDAAFKAGLKTAQVDWVAILNSGTISAEFLELPRQGGEIERELVAASVLTAQEVAMFGRRNIAWRDMIWTKAATHIIRTRKPNLLLFHPLATDSLNHTYGPGSSASLAGFALADRLVGDVLEALESAGLKEKATVVITTDHGFKKVAKLVYPNVALRQAGLLTAKGANVTRCDAYVVAQGGIAFAFVTDPARKAELLPVLRKTYEALEGVDRVLDGSEAPTLGMPTPEENQGMGDLILFAKAGYAFQRNADGEAAVIESRNYFGSHGYPSTDPEMDGILIAWGHGIRPGAKLERANILDIAPTLAELLGVEMPPMEGRVLREILTTAQEPLSSK